jgi:hypothetical protein
VVAQVKAASHFLGKEAISSYPPIRDFSKINFKMINNNNYIMILQCRISTAIRMTLAIC